MSRYLLVARCILVGLADLYVGADLLKFAEQNLELPSDVIKPPIGLPVAIILGVYGVFPLMKEFEPDRKKEQ